MTKRAAAQTATQSAPKKTRTRKPKEEAQAPQAQSDVIEISEEEAEALFDEAAEGRLPDDLVSAVKAAKRRVASAAERDEHDRVVRKGRNLSGNQPFRGKPYYLDLDIASGPEWEKAVNAAPMQVRLILKYMAEAGITTPDDAERGGTIAGEAINKGYLQSKIAPAALFAYYRRVMERLGLRLAIGE